MLALSRYKAKMYHARINMYMHIITKKCLLAVFPYADVMTSYDLNSASGNEMISLYGDVANSYREMILMVFRLISSYRETILSYAEVILPYADIVSPYADTTKKDESGAK